MTPIEKVSVADLRRVTELANLELTDGEQVSMLRDLNSILDYVAQLNELDTSAVPAMSQVGDALVAIRRDPMPWREDEVVPSLARATVMAGAPESDGVFFLVPKVIER